MRSNGSKRMGFKKIFYNMNKFTITELPETNEENPVLYKIYFGSNYYIHKGKKLKESLDRMLDDVFRGTRGKVCPKQYHEIVSLCRKYPSLHKVSVDVLLNSEPDKIIKKEAALLKSAYKDTMCLNDPKEPPYIPEWMMKETLGKRCDKSDCIKSGFFTLAIKLPVKFKFCPNCGRLNK